MKQEEAEVKWSDEERVSTIEDMEKYVTGLEDLLQHESGQITMEDVKYINEEINRFKGFLSVAKKLKL